MREREREIERWEIPGRARERAREGTLTEGGGEADVAPGKERESNDEGDFHV